MAVGLIGGATAVHPTAKTCVKILGVKTASELAQIIASVGLAQNFAALRALATEGIQRGHMRLHAKQIVKQISAGRFEEQVLTQLVQGPITYDRALHILNNLKNNRGTNQS